MKSHRAILPMLARGFFFSYMVSQWVNDEWSDGVEENEWEQLAFEDSDGGGIVVDSSGGS